MSLAFLPSNNDDELRFVHVDADMRKTVREDYAHCSNLPAGKLVIEMYAIKHNGGNVIAFRPLSGDPVFTACNDLMNNTLNLLVPEALFCGDLYVGYMKGDALIELSRETLMSFLPALTALSINSKPRAVFGPETKAQ